MKLKPRNAGVMLLWRIALLYIVMMLCRAAFYIYNMDAIGPLGWSELWPLVCGALKFDTASVIYANALFIILSLLPIRAREAGWYNRLLFWYYIVVNTVTVVALNLADAVYFRYTLKRFTADEIFFADNTNSMGLAAKFLAENWPLAIFALAMVMLLSFGYRRHTPIVSRLVGGWFYIFNTILLALGCALCVAGVRGGFTRTTRPITLSNATLYAPDSARANMILSNPFCVLRTMGNGKVKYVRYFEPQDLERKFSPYHQPADSAAVQFKGRNVVVMIMESMSADHSAHLMPQTYADREIKGFTPFLDSLMRQGYTFERMYANGTRSIQAMPSILGSIPSFKAPFVLMPQSLGESRQLPAILSGMGYETAFFCGSDRSSMGFGAYARSAGVERLYNREEYEARHGSDDFDGYWGIWDEPFLQFMGEELSTLRQPFFASVFTITPHHPFVVPTADNLTLPDGYTAIHKSVAYSDRAVRRFFDRYGSQEWFNNTIFLFVADHVSSEKFASESKTHPGNLHIIGFIYTPDGALRGSTGQVAQQLDVMPTILGLVGNSEPYFAYGRDLLNEPSRPAWCVSYDGGFRALTDSLDVKVDEQRTITTDRKTGKEVAADSLQDGFKALIQQYYTHVEQKSYIVK